MAKDPMLDLIDSLSHQVEQLHRVSSARQFALQNVLSLLISRLSRSGALDRKAFDGDLSAACDYWRNKPDVPEDERRAIEDMIEAIESIRSSATSDAAPEEVAAPEGATPRTLSVILGGKPDP